MTIYSLYLAHLAFVRMETTWLVRVQYLLETSHLYPLGDSQYWWLPIPSAMQSLFTHQTNIYLVLNLCQKLSTYLGCIFESLYSGTYRSLFKMDYNVY